MARTVDPRRAEKPPVVKVTAPHACFASTEKRNCASWLNCLLTRFLRLGGRVWCNHCIPDDDMKPTVAALATMAIATFSLFTTPVNAQTSRDNPTEMERPEVKSFRLIGVKSVDKGELKLGLATKASECKNIVFKVTLFCLTKGSIFYERNYLDHDELARDALRVLVFYFKRGYRDAQVDTSITRVAPGEVNVTINVTEGPATVVHASSVEGGSNVLSEKEIARNLRPAAGETLNLIALDSTAVRLKSILWQQGYADAVVTSRNSVDDSANTSTVRVEVDPKRKSTIGEIVIMGNSKVDAQSIRNSLLIEPGDIFRRSSVGQSQRALYESGLFKQATIDTLPGRDTVKTVVVRVQEATLREARLSGGFTTADFVQVEGRFTDNYWLGGARRLDIGITFGNLFAQQLSKSSFFADIANIVADNNLGRFYAPTYQASADIRQRWFQSPRNTVGVGIFTHRRSSAGVFVDRGYGASGTFTRDVVDRGPLSLIYRFEVARVEAGDVYFCVNYGVCDNATIGALRGRHKLSPISTTFSLNRTDAPFSPTRGVLGRAELEHASAFTASDFRYNRAYVEVAVYKQISFRNSVAAARVRGGWVDPLSSTAAAVGAPIETGDVGGAVGGILHPRKRFYAGGSQSVRGFGENQLGPRVLTIDPDKLRGKRDSSGTTLYSCNPSIAIQNCGVNADGLTDSDFQSRPLGGTTLLEAGVELRIPVWGPLVGALFVDGAILGEGALNSITKGTGAITPGFGIRYESPVGPVRVDLGFRPTLREPLRVITQVTDSLGRRTLVDLSPSTGCTSGTLPGCRTYPDPNKTRSFLDRVTSRLTLHLSIGQAF